MQYPPTEESIARLHRSGWSCGETAWHAIAGGVAYQVDVINSENRIRVEACDATRGVVAGGGGR